jgi:hypothetical protein
MVTKKKILKNYPYTKKQLKIKSIDFLLFYILFLLIFDIERNNETSHKRIREEGEKCYIKTAGKLISISLMVTMHMIYNYLYLFT